MDPKEDEEEEGSIKKNNSDPKITFYERNDDYLSKQDQLSSANLTYLNFAPRRQLPNDYLPVSSIINVSRLKQSNTNM